MPTAVMGEHVTPTSPSTSCATIPREPRIVAMPGSVALCTELQHWMAPVLHVEEPDCGSAVAAARIAERATREVDANMLGWISFGVEFER